MSQTLGEKLRKAREDRGISISEVAEQTRISSLYLESIENDDYKILPGGIFNKGFVKSYAKYVGVDEHEALQDYSNIVAKDSEDDLRVYRPEVLTDERSISSMAPTIIFAVIILGLMTAGILFGVNYYQNLQEQPSIASNSNSETSNTNRSLANANTENRGNLPVPSMANLKVEFKTTGENISVSAVSDGNRSNTLVTLAKSMVYEPKDKLSLSYSRSLAEAARLSINGREITLPETPESPRRAAIEFVIDKNNIAAIWDKGRISFDDEAEPSPTPEATSEPVDTPKPRTPAPSTPEPTPSATQTPTVRATRTPARTPAPDPTRETIVVGQPTPDNN